MAGGGGGGRGHGRYVVVGGPGWRGRLISQAPQLGRPGGARSSPPVYAARSPAPLTRGRWAVLRSEPGITSARTLRGSEDDIPSGMRRGGSEGTESRSRRQRRRCHTAEGDPGGSRGEGEAAQRTAAHPAGGEGARGREEGAKRAQKKQSYRSIGVSLYYSSDALIALMCRGGAGGYFSRIYTLMGVPEKSQCSRILFSR